MTVIWMIIKTILLLVMLPLCAGASFSVKKKGIQAVLYSWIMGQMLLWAVFLLTTVPLIFTYQSFDYAVLINGIAYILIPVISVALCLVLKKNDAAENGLSKCNITADKTALICFVATLGILIFQIVMIFLYSYNDADDAYYIATANIAQNSDLMYIKKPYTGYYSDLTKRYALAPMPMWLAFCTEITGVHIAVFSHVVWRITALVMYYSLIYLWSDKLFKKAEQKSWFCLFMAVLLLFGSYSVYTPENFLVGRAPQGKAILASIIIPLISLMFFEIMQKQKMGEKNKGIFASLAIVLAAACLCSTMGSLIACIMAGLLGIILTVMYKKLSYLIYSGLACFVPFVFCLVYLLVE